MHIPETSISDLDWSTVPSPCYVVDTRLLERNAQILGRVRREAGVHVLAALKAFSLWKAFPVLAPYLDGACASGPWEAQLAREEFGKEVHTYAPAFSDQDMAETLRFTDHLVFNSPAQLARHLPAVRACGRPITCGIRINPEYAEVEVDLYNPCALGSRLGSRREVLGKTLPEGL
jgi:carboxynorspermidine decarboxylase